MKDVKKLLKEGAREVLPDERVKRNIERELNRIGRPDLIRKLYSGTNIHHKTNDRNDHNRTKRHGQDKPGEMRRRNRGK